MTIDGQGSSPLATEALVGHNFRPQEAKSQETHLQKTKHAVVGLTITFKVRFTEMDGCWGLDVHCKMDRNFY